MTTIFFILIVIACIILGFIVLIQNPKGGGLSGTLAGFNNQFMGVKQTTDVLEKGTWIFAAIIGILCLTSSLFIGGNKKTGNNTLDKINTNITAPAQQQPIKAPSAVPNPAPNK